MTWLKVYISLEKEIFPEAAYNLCVYQAIYAEINTIYVIRPEIKFRPY